MKPSRDINRLLEIMAALRTPETGCPWDLEQDFQSISPYTIEEAYEVADAIERGDMVDLKMELGDLLLQSVYHAQMAQEQHLFDFGDVVQAVTEKMIRRHPHVFGDEKARSAGMAKGAWERMKALEKAEIAKEKAATGPLQDEDIGMLDSVPVTLPATMAAYKLQERAARVGFDWAETSDVMAKIGEELGEVEEAAAAGEPASLREEIGDLLFAAVNLARHHGIDPETALAATNLKFRKRFHYIEKRLAEAGTAMADATLEQMEAHWQEAKEKQKNSNPSA